MNMPARRHRTSPHKGTSCGAKGGMLADGPRICTIINEYCMKWRSLLFRTSFQLFHKTDFETGIIFRNFASLKISDMLWKQKRYTIIWTKLFTCRPSCWRFSSWPWAAKGRRAAHGLRMKVQTQSLLTAPFKSIPERPQLPEVNIWTNSVKSAVILLIRSMAVDVALI